MNGEIAWTCDFCGKGGLQLSPAGYMYCPFCHKSDGKHYPSLKQIREQSLKQLAKTLREMVKRNGRM